jgi:hypothetical protein
MRTLLFCVLAATAVGAYGEERTWTISYTTQAELVEVRGDMIYLRATDGVQSIPISQLSNSDRQYVASLPLAPVTQSVAANQGGMQGAVNQTADNSLPSPGSDATAIEPAGFTAPETSGPALMAPSQVQSGERSVLTAPQGGVIRAQNLESADLPAPNFASEPVPTAQSIPQNRNVQNFNGQNLNGNGANQQRPLTAKQQRAADRKRAEADSRPGLFGARQRRLLGGRD